MKPRWYIVPALILCFYSGLFSQELLQNSDFDTDGLSGWLTPVPEGSTVEAIEYDWGVDIFFDLSEGGGGENSCDVQLIQTGIAVKPGYTYTITLGGSGYYSDKSILVGIGKDGSEKTGDGSGVYDSYAEKSFTLTENTYGESKFVWNDTDITDSNARFFINGGGDDVSFTIAWASVYQSVTSGDTVSGDTIAHVNQVGYYTSGQKIAVIPVTSVNTYEIRDTLGESQWSGQSVASDRWAPSAEIVQKLDFSAFKKAGVYAVFSNGKKISSDFTISPTPYVNLGKAALKAFYYQRASMDLLPAYAGEWARGAGKKDSSATIHSSAGSGSFSSRGGWYDAGDYGRYIVNSGITTYTLFLLYRNFPDYMKNISLNIPESGNSMPDVLDEIKWNLDWMLTMQAADGGVYHKLTPLKFDDFVMPDECTSQRYAFMKTTSASLNFAAVMALASRVFYSYDPTFASTCLSAAKTAFTWAVNNPAVYFVQPAGVNTGEYGDKDVSDERFWAAAELTAATDSSYSSFLTVPSDIPLPSWDKTGCLGLFTILANKGIFSATVYQNAKDQVTTIASILLNAQSAGYKVSLTSDDFNWGSNSIAANQGVLLLYAYYLTDQTDYLNAAISQLDYLLGRNPIDMCYVTGQGFKSPLHIHHRISEADNVINPVPGFLVGGPNENGEDITDESCITDYISEPASSYLDNVCSYATNEIAINWNAPLAYLSNSLDALFSGEKPNLDPIDIHTAIAPEIRGVKNPEMLSISNYKSDLVITFGGLKTGVKTISIFDIKGRELYKVKSGAYVGTDGRVLLSTKGLGRGIFFAVIDQGNGRINKQFVIR